MRMRLIPVVVVLGPVIAGIALAQPTGEQPKPQAHDKATLRAQVAKLRGEIELLRLEHEADRDCVRELILTTKKTEMIPFVMSMTGRAADAPVSVNAPGSVHVPKTEKEWTELETRGMLGDLDAAETFKKLYQAGDEAQKKGENPEKAMDAAARELSRQAKNGGGFQGHFERKSKAFVKQAAELAEKQLILEELEKQYQKAE